MLSRLLHTLRCSALAVLALAAISASPASAAIGDPYDTPTLTCVSNGENSINIRVTAGPSGAPAGVSIQWMLLSDYEANGNAWYASDDPRLCKLSLSGQPSWNGNNETLDWELGPNGSFVIQIGGNLFDETGASSSCAGEDLLCGETYVFRSFAHATNEHKRSAFSANLECTTADCPGQECTYTQGYWKTHGTGDCDVANDSGQWPVAGLTLGGQAYTAAELCAIFNKPAQGNGAISLAHQLIAAKLNVAKGASDCAAANTAIAAADALIAASCPGKIPPSGNCSIANNVSSDLTNTLASFNEGTLCNPHCGGPALKSGATPGVSTPTNKASWGSLKQIYR